MASRMPGSSPAGTLASAAILTVVEAQTCSEPRWGRDTCAVAVPEEMVPLVVMKARPFMTCSAPVTMEALPGRWLSSGTMAMGLAGAVAAGMETTDALSGVCACRLGVNSVNARASKRDVKDGRNAGQTG